MMYQGKFAVFLGKILAEILAEKLENPNLSRFSGLIEDLQTDTFIAWSTQETNNQ